MYIYLFIIKKRDLYHNILKDNIYIDDILFNCLTIVFLSCTVRHVIENGERTVSVEIKT